MKVSLNVASVKSKLVAWDKSAAGTATKRKKIDEYINNDTRQTQAGSTVVTLDWANEMAEELCGMIKGAAASSGKVAGSVLANVSSISSSGASYVGGGAIVAELSFSGGLLRPSLAPNLYSSVNIVALFEKGYTASDHVYGVWGDAMIASRLHRDGVGFIHSAVAEFNAKYAYLGVQATILGIYA